MSSGNGSGVQGGLNGEKQNETGYKLSRKTFVMTDFTRRNLMDGAVSAGNDLEMIQINGSMCHGASALPLPVSFPHSQEGSG